jgi:nucleotide-binding universal stress UspA family protein
METDGFERVLVPTDGSDTSAAAVDHGLSLAAAYGASVRFVFVSDIYSMSTIPKSREEREYGEALIDSLVERADEEGVPASGTVRAGFPHEEILAEVDQTGADLVVMSSHGRTGVGRYLMGSVTEKVVRLSDVPILTVHGERVPAEYDRVLVPTDGSDSAAAAERRAVDVAREFDAALDVLTVVETTGVGFDVRSEQHRAASEAAAGDIVDAAVGRAREAGVERVEGAVSFGTPHRKIRSYAEERGADLIVVGTHGRTGLDRYLLGSVAERVLRLATVPVLTVPLPADGADDADDAPAADGDDEGDESDGGDGTSG